MSRQRATAVNLPTKRSDDVTTNGPSPADDLDVGDTVSSRSYYECAKLYYHMMRDLGLEPREPFHKFMVNAVLLYLGHKDAQVVLDVDRRHPLRFVEYLDAFMLDMDY